jgi:hypothetical protein
MHLLVGPGMSLDRTIPAGADLVLGVGIDLSLEYG